MPLLRSSFKARLIASINISLLTEFENPATIMVEPVERILVLNQQLTAAKLEHEQTALKRQIAATDRQIDHLVYELYGLSEEEIGTVEESR